MTQAEAIARVEAALRQLQAPVGADDVAAATALVLGMDAMARRLASGGAIESRRGDAA